MSAATLGLDIGTSIGVLWIAWLIYWWASASGTKPTTWREPLASAAMHRVPLWLAAYMMAAPNRLPHLLRVRWLPSGPAGPIAGLVLVAAGLGFTVWARVHLGRNWSGAVTVKAEHTLIRTGPYRFVRHPIYTGLLTAFVGSALAVGEWRGVVGLGLAVASLVRKSRVEEARMRETFPEYDEYRQHTAALVPFLY